jgi:hypothetical protein
LCHAPRDDLAGTCKVIPSPVRRPLGLRRTGRIKERRHSGEIKGRVEKKVQLKLPVEADSWETGTRPSPCIPARHDALGKAKREAKEELGDTGNTGGPGW